jgi:hypothetical protein
MILITSEGVIGPCDVNWQPLLKPLISLRCGLIAEAPYLIINPQPIRCKLNSCCGSGGGGLSVLYTQKKTKVAMVHSVVSCMFFWLKLKNLKVYGRSMDKPFDSL